MWHSRVRGEGRSLTEEGEGLAAIQKARLDWDATSWAD